MTRSGGVSLFLWLVRGSTEMVLQLILLALLGRFRDFREYAKKKSPPSWCARGGAVNLLDYHFHYVLWHV
jgi:hypothetical protein